MECPYKKECAITMYWEKEQADFIKEVCNTDKYVECLHFSSSLQPQHEERQRLYGDPHANEPDWDEVRRKNLRVQD